MSRRFAVAMLCGLLPGCVFYQDYPSDWGKPNGQGGCASLSGRYAALGESAESPDRKNVRIANLLLNHHDLSEPDYVEISYMEGILRLQGFEKQVMVFEKGFSAHDDNLSCSSSGAVVNARSGMTEGMSNPLVGVTTGSTTLRRAADRALTVKRSDHAVGLVYMFLPVLVGDVQHYRFAAAD